MFAIANVIHLSTAVVPVAGGCQCPALASTSPACPAVQV